MWKSSNTKKIPKWQLKLQRGVFVNLNTTKYISLQYHVVLSHTTTEVGAPSIWIETEMDVFINWVLLVEWDHPFLADDWIAPPEVGVKQRMQLKTPMIRKAYSESDTSSDTSSAFPFVLSHSQPKENLVIMQEESSLYSSTTIPTPSPIIPPYRDSSLSSSLFFLCLHIHQVHLLYHLSHHLESLNYTCKPLPQKSTIPQGFLELIIKSRCLAHPLHV